METIKKYESEVRSYVRSFPTVFDRAKGSFMYNEAGEEFLDFFSGAGVLNYGHNPDVLKKALQAYIERDGVTHSLDMASKAKTEFLQRFYDVIMAPRDMEYRVQFPGPTGTNSVEAALKLARKVKQRETVVSFTNAFHGMTLGSLSVTGNMFKRSGAGVPLSHSVAVPFYDYFDDGTDTADYLARLLEDQSSGLDLPAAIILETVQAEGGINVADFDWLKRIEGLCREHDILLIIDDIQVGAGRTGPFFSFEPAGIKPDIICLSKSLSGYGLPFAVTLIKPELDKHWDPGEHNGTFRGHNLAFVTATTAFEEFWQDDALSKEVERKGQIVRKYLNQLVSDHPEIEGKVRGRGLINGLDSPVEGWAKAVSKACFERNLVLEVSGPTGNVLKLMPTLTIGDADLARGLGLVREAIEAVSKERGLAPAEAS